MSGAAYVTDSGHVFLTLQDLAHVNAWGIYNVAGALFDTVDGTVQAGAVATCNLPSSVADIVSHAICDRLGAALVAVVPMA